jgi:DMSO reductase anchor subunit
MSWRPARTRTGLLAAGLLLASFHLAVPRHAWAQG